MSRNVNATGSNVIIGSTLTDTTVINGSTRPLTKDMWAEVYTLTGRHAKGDEMMKLIEMKALLDDGKGMAAKPIWQKLKPFFSQVLQHSANLAQIIGTIDTLTHTH